MESHLTARDGNVVRLDVPADYADGERIDTYLTRFYPEASRAKVQRSIAEGHIRVGGAAVKKSYAVEGGDRIVFRLIQPPPVEARPEPIPLDVAYEDDDLLVVVKPAGMVVHPAPGHHSGTLVNALLHHVGGSAIEVAEGEEDDVADGLDDEALGLSVVNALPPAPGHPVIRPGIVHRLDKGTSGLLVVAKHDRAHRHLAAQFKAHTTRRRYMALVWGHPEPPEGTLAGAIGRDPHDRKRMAVVADDRGKAAVTHYAVAARHAHTAVVTFRLETGRTHQIRVHAQAAGHPVVGDATYGGQTIRYGNQGRKRRAFFDRLFEAMPRPALHAATLGFEHPATGAAMTFEAPVPGDMQYVMDELRRVEGTEG